MLKTIRSRQEHRAWQQKYDKNAPKAGDLAPDFELWDVHNERTVKLSDFRGEKPVALIFGSYTWPPFVNETVRLHDLYRLYQDRVQFLAIYIREAHPRDGWWLGGGLMGRALRISGSKAAFDVYDPKSMDERKKVAQRFEQALEYRIPILVDEIDDPVNKTYAALPTRLYLINKIGIIVYAGGLGPFGFKPSELKLAIDQLLGEYE